MSKIIQETFCQLTENHYLYNTKKTTQLKQKSNETDNKANRKAVG